MVVADLVGCLMVVTDLVCGLVVATDLVGCDGGGCSGWLSDGGG